MGESFVFVCLLFGLAAFVSFGYCWFILDTRKVHVPVLIVVLIWNSILGNTACALIVKDELAAHPEKEVPETPIDRPGRVLPVPKVEVNK